MLTQYYCTINPDMFDSYERLKNHYDSVQKERGIQAQKIKSCKLIGARNSNPVQSFIRNYNYNYVDNA